MIDPPRASGLDIDELAAAVWAVVLELRPENAGDETILQHVRGLTVLPHQGTAELLVRCEEHGLLEKGSLSAEAFDVMVRLRLRHFQLVRAHRPGMIRADLAIWWAGEPVLPSAWSAHTHGRLNERSLGGSHYTIVVPPRIDVVVNELRALCEGESPAKAPALHSRNRAGLTA